MNRLTWLAKLYGCIGFAACAAAAAAMFAAAGWLWIISAGAVAFAAFSIGIWLDHEDTARQSNPICGSISREGYLCTRLPGHEPPHESQQLGGVHDGYVSGRWIIMGEEQQRG